MAKPTQSVLSLHMRHRARGPSASQTPPAVFSPQQQWRATLCVTFVQPFPSLGPGSLPHSASLVAIPARFPLQHHFTDEERYWMLGPM